MERIRIGLIGYKFMGRAHSNAYRQVAAYFPDRPAPEMIAICGRDKAAVDRARATLGWQEMETDWQRLITRDDIDVIDVATPGYLHHDMVLAALAAGKHVYCEKPLANSLDEASAMVQAWRQAGAIGMINFNYRAVPAVALAKQLISEGRIGRILHWRARYLQDWLTDPTTPISWRLRHETAGSGALGDIAAHSTDLARFLVGEISEVVGTMTTFTPRRPTQPLAATVDPEYDDVTVDDHTSFLARFENGASGTFEASRVAAGRRNNNTFEINGELGSIVFDLERLNELEVFFVDDERAVQGFRRIQVTDSVHPWVNRWWPVGHNIGWEHTHVHMVATLLQAVQDGVQPAPSFDDGFRCQAVLDAVERSVASGQWERPADLPAR